MNTKIKLYITIFFASCLTSCSNYLDVKPLDSFTGDAIFSDLKLTETYVNKRYTEIRDGFGNLGLRYISDEAYHNFNSGNPYLYNRGEVADQLGTIPHGMLIMKRLRTAIFSLIILIS